MDRIIFNVDHLDAVKSRLFRVIADIDTGDADLKTQNIVINACKGIQHDAKLRLQAAMLLGKANSTLQLAADAQAKAPANAAPRRSDDMKRAPARS